MPAEPRLLVVAPGMTLSEVRAASTVTVDSVDLECMQIGQPREPHRVLVRDARREFELPAGRFSIIETDGAIVVRLRATPQLEALPWDPACALIDRLATSLEGQGWERRLRLAPSEVAEHLKSSSEDRAGRWTHGAWEAELWIRRIVTAGTRLAELMQRTADSYLVTVVLWDERLCGYPSATQHEGQ